MIKDESVLIREYNDITREISELQYLKNALPDRFTDRDEHLLRENEIKKSQLGERLSTLTERPLSAKKLQALISQFDAIIGELKEGRNGLLISGNQGLIFETAIYSFIIRDIEFALSMEGHIWSTPHYYYEHDSKFNHKPVKDLLRNYLDRLREIDLPDYILLESLVVSCTRELQDMAREDYRRIYSSSF